MTVAWERIPGQGLYTSEEQTEKRRQVALQRLKKALGEDLVEELLSKGLFVLLPSFAGYAALSAAGSHRLAALERSCAYIQKHNTLYVNLEHFDDPAFVSHVVSALAIDTVEHQDKHLAFYENACSHLLHSFGDSPLDLLAHRKSYHKRTPIVIRAKLERLTELKAFFEDYWLNNYENRKAKPAIKNLKKRSTKLPADPSTVTEQNLVAWLFGNIDRFARSIPKKGSRLFDIVHSDQSPVPLAYLAKKTTDKIPDIEKLFGKRLNKNDLDMRARLPYPAEMGMISQNANPRYVWNLDTEMSETNWAALFSAQATPAGVVSSEHSIFANGIAMSLPSLSGTSVNVIVTHKVDRVHLKNRTLNFLPFVPQRARPFSAQIVGCAVPSSLDWALLKLKSKKYDLNFSALNTSWLTQADKLNAYSNYSVNLTFWALAANSAQKEDNKDLCPDTEFGDRNTVAHYKLVVKISEVVYTCFFEGLEYTIFNIRPCFNRKSFPEITAALPAAAFAALKLENRKTVVLHGIFLATGFNKPKFYAVDVADLLHKSENISTLAMRRYLDLTVTHGAIDPEAASIHLAHRVSNIGQHRRFSPCYYEALQMAAAYGDLNSLKRLAHLYSRTLDKIQQLKNFNVNFILDCENKVLNRFLRVCQTGCVTNLESLAVEVNELLPAPEDIRARLSKYLALTGGSPMAWDDLARNFRNNRPLQEMTSSDAIEYRGYLERAVFDYNYWPAAKPLAELYLSGKLPDASLSDAINLILNAEKVIPAARAWFTGIMLMQESFFTASDQEIFEAFKKQAQFGSPLYIRGFAWFLITTAFDKRNTPMAWALTGVGLLNWLVEHYDCPAYFDLEQTALCILNELGIVHRWADFDPWKYLNVSAPSQGIALIRSVYPVGFPEFVHQIFLDNLANITQNEAEQEVQTRVASILEFLVENAFELGKITGKTLGDRVRTDSRILSLGQKDKNECIITQTSEGGTSWLCESICPVFYDGLTLDVKVMGAITDLWLCTGVVTATADGINTLHSFDPYWMLHAPEFRVGEVYRFSYYGLGSIQSAEGSYYYRNIIDTPQKHIKCTDERTAQYAVVSVVKSIKRNAVEIAGVSFAKVVIVLDNFVPHLTDAQLPVYVPMNQFDAKQIKRNTRVLATFELHAKLLTQSTVSEATLETRTIN